MADGIKPIRRVVTGNDAQGRSKVLFDSAAPRVTAGTFKKGTGMTDIWMFDTCPALISGERDDGDLPFHFEPPATGGRLRIVQSDPRPADYDPATDKFITPEHPPRKTEGGTWERGRQSLYTTRIHKSETVDYGILLSGERVLITDAGEHVLKRGDVVVQLGSWHAWSDRNYGSHDDADEIKTKETNNHVNPVHWHLAHSREREWLRKQDRCAGSSSSTKMKDPRRSPTDRVPMCAPTRRGRDLRRPVSG